MALKNSATLSKIVNSDEVTAFDLDRGIAGLASGSFLPPSYYSSNIVEQQIGSLQPFYIDFQGSQELTSPNSIGLLGDFVPTFVESLPLNLGYIRSAAFSIAEACFQLSGKLDTPLSKEELKMIIAENVLSFLKDELERIESYRKQDNVFLHPTLSKRFDIVEKILLAEIGNIATEYVGNYVQDRKGSAEQVLDNRNGKAANDNYFSKAA